MATTADPHAVGQAVAGYSIAVAGSPVACIVAIMDLDDGFAVQPVADAMGAAVARNRRALGAGSPFGRDATHCGRVFDIGR